MVGAVEVMFLQPGDELFWYVVGIDNKPERRIVLAPGYKI
jgi:hypothetical protein